MEPSHTEQESWDNFCIHPSTTSACMQSVGIRENKGREDSMAMNDAQKLTHSSTPDLEQLYLDLKHIKESAHQS